MQKAPKEAGKKAVVTEFNPGFTKNNKYVDILEVVKAVSNTVDIMDAKILVSGGRGVGSPENFKILDDLAYGDKYGEVLRAKGMVPSEEKGVWLHFDMVPEQAEIREGAPDFTGKVCVIGAELDEEGLKAAFNA
jgi:hypothetical protein